MHDGNSCMMQSVLIIFLLINPINITINAREEGKFSIKYSDMAPDILLVQDYRLTNTTEDWTIN